MIATVILVIAVECSAQLAAREKARVREEVQYEALGYMPLTGDDGLGRTLRRLTVLSFQQATVRSEIMKPRDIVMREEQSTYWYSVIREKSSETRLQGVSILI